MHRAGRATRKAAIRAGPRVANDSGHMHHKFLIGLSLLVAAGACQLVSGADEFDFTPGTTSAGGGGAPIHEGGGGGALIECLAPDDCPGEQSTCAFRTCVESMCSIDAAPAGTACSESEGAMCNGIGNCVACLETDHCAPTDICDQQVCVPAACADDALSGEETDVDCGGPECTACENDKSCLVATDCQSLYCSGVCSACENDGHCMAAAGTFCDAGACAPLRQLGEACQGANQCESGNCVDGVCCDSDCGGTCRACHIAKTGVASGTCTYIPNGNDPDQECLLTVCNGNGGCTL
jgi:hypothetical protein